MSCPSVTNLQTLEKMISFVSAIEYIPFIMNLFYKQDGSTNSKQQVFFGGK